MKESEDKKILCARCNVPLVMKKTDLKYQNQAMSTELLRCPECGQVFIPEDLVKGKMFDIEKELEDK